jgi:hypothetical protein
MAKKTKDKPLSLRQQQLVDLLPDYDWSIVKAGLAAGYSQSYSEKRLKHHVEKNIVLCRAIADKRTAVNAGSEDKREQTLKKLDSIIDDPTSSTSARLRAIEVKCRMMGWFSETIVHDTGPHAQARNKLMEAEAKRLADGLLKPYQPKYIEAKTVTPDSTEQQEPIGGGVEIPKTPNADSINDSPLPPQKISAAALP